MEDAITPPFVCPYEINDYKLLNVIGCGAFSVVYKCERMSDNVIFAIKIIPKKLVKSEDDKKRLQREIDAMVMVKHDSIVELHDFFQNDDHFFLVIDFCHDGEMFHVLEEKGRLTDGMIATIYTQIVSAVEFCHKHEIAHRDLKPQNVLFTHYPVLKIADFGLCGYTSPNQKMKTFCGSPCYSAPECLKMTSYDGKKSDVWSLGVILYELATYQHPWDVNNIPKMIEQIKFAKYTIPRSVSNSLADLIRSILKLNPADRPTCQEILQHPFLMLAAKRRNRKEVSILPPLNRFSLPSNTNAIQRANDVKANGIVSPFDGLFKTSGNQPQNMERQNLLSSLRKSRSGSFLNKPRLSLPSDGLSRTLKRDRTKPAHERPIPYPVAPPLTAYSHERSRV